MNVFTLNMILVISFLIQSSNKSCNSYDYFKSLTVYYLDTLTNSKEHAYRELEYIGEEPFWSKPESFDILIEINETRKGLNYYIEVLIEECIQSTELNTFNTDLNKNLWVPHTVVFSGNASHVKDGKLKIENVEYQTAYFKSSLLYLKKGFRVIAIIYIRDDQYQEISQKEYLFPE